jgi:pimeloyl-ACP methyl ester carboxylesterase
LNPTTKQAELNGITLTYNVYENEGAPVLVLIHGLASTKESYNLTIPYLADKYHVLSLDLRGSGGSSQVGPYTMDQLAEDIKAVLDHERIEKATLVGGSLGCTPIQLLAVRYPERVEKLVLLDGGFAKLASMPGYDLDEICNREPFSAASMEEMQANVMAGYRQYGSEFVNEQTLRETVQKADGRVYLALPHEAFVSYLTDYATFDLDYIAAHIKAPILVLQAAWRADFFDDAIRDYLAAFPTAQAYQIPDSPHPLMVSHPQEVAERIDRFVQA